MAVNVPLVLQLLLANQTPILNALNKRSTFCNVLNQTTASFLKATFLEDVPICIADKNWSVTLIAVELPKFTTLFALLAILALVLRLVLLREIKLLLGPSLPVLSLL